MFLRQDGAFSGNRAGTGGLVTFKDSRWLMSIVLAHQPHFAGQPDDVQVFWGYALHPDRIGDFVAKPMADCTAGDPARAVRPPQFRRREFRRATASRAGCPTSPACSCRARERPAAAGAAELENLAFVSQFGEIADDVVFTVEYSVRAAQMAVYHCSGRPSVPPVTRTTSRSP